MFKQCSKFSFTTKISFNSFLLAWSSDLQVKHGVASRGDPPLFGAVLNLPSKLLVLEDNPFQVEILIEHFKRLYPISPTVLFTGHLSEFESTLSLQEFDAFIVDLNVVDAKSDVVSSFLKALPTEIKYRTIIHTSEPWTSIKRLGLSEFQVLQKGFMNVELMEALVSKS